MSSLDHVMERIGRIVAADRHLSVKVQGKNAYAVAGEVVIPAIEAFAHLGKGAERMLQGLLDHECGHASETDFDCFERSAKRGASFKCLVNALEDIYVESRVGARYPGSQQNLAKKNIWFWETKTEDLAPVSVRIKEWALWESFLLALTMVGRQYGGRSIAEIRALRPEVADMLELCAAEIEEVRALSYAKATPRVLELAEKVYERFARPESKSQTSPEGEGSGSAAEQSEPSAPSDGEAKGESERGESESGSGGPGEEADGESESESGDPEPSGQHEGKLSPALAKKIKIELRRFSESGAPLTPEQQVDVEIRRAFDQPSDTRPYAVFSHEYDLERDLSATDLSGYSSEYDSLLERAREASDLLASAFDVSLHAKRAKRPICGADEGEFDVAMLGEFAVGAAQPDTLYLQHAAEDDREVSVAILVDCSGSMGAGQGTKSDVAKVAAVAMSAALQRVQIAHEVCGFTSVDSAHSGCPWIRGIESAVNKSQASYAQALSNAEKRGKDLSGLARGVHSMRTIVPFHAVLKSFGSDDARALTQIGGYAENLDGEAVLWQARRLAARPENRRVLFVLSDGYPAGSYDNAQGAAYLKETMQRVISAGIEAYGIGIKSTAVEQFYPRYWVVNDLEDLCSIAVSSMAQVILQHREERGRVWL